MCVALIIMLTVMSIFKNDVYDVFGLNTTMIAVYSIRPAVLTITSYSIEVSYNNKIVFVGTSFV